MCRADGAFNNVIRGTGAAVPTAALVWRRTSGTNFQISKASGKNLQIRKGFKNNSRGTETAVQMCAEMCAEMRAEMRAEMSKGTY